MYFIITMEFKSDLILFMDRAQVSEQ